MPHRIGGFYPILPPLNCSCFAYSVAHRINLWNTEDYSNCHVNRVKLTTNGEHNSNVSLLLIHYTGRCGLGLDKAWPGFGMDQYSSLSQYLHLSYGNCCWVDHSICDQAWDPEFFKSPEPVSYQSLHNGPSQAGVGTCPYPTPWKLKKKAKRWSKMVHCGEEIFFPWNYTDLMNNPWGHKKKKKKKRNRNKKPVISQKPGKSPAWWWPLQIQHSLTFILNTPYCCNMRSTAPLRTRCTWYVSYAQTSVSHGYRL